MQHPARRAFFLDTDRGACFFLVTEPQQAPLGTLLFVPPFAEELNKTRRMVALAARRFADAGWRVVQFDLLGTGDSSGDFGDATWEGWLDDMGVAIAWCRQQMAGEPILWSLRAGALLASDWQARANTGLPQLMWQPVINGRQHLTQFLRLKTAASITGSGAQPASTADLLKSLLGGQPLEVAGYLLAPDLVKGLEAAKLAPTGQSRTAVIEVAAEDRLVSGPATERALAAFRESGGEVAIKVVAGVAFWQTLEVETAPTLLEASLDLLGIGGGLS